jgi:hypothetical protein
MESASTETERATMAVRCYLKAGRAAYLGDIHAEIYANKLKAAYDNIQDVIIFEAFNTMTEHLMAEQYINRTHLIVAIDDFENSEIGIKCLADYDYDGWTQFIEMAHNCRSELDNIAGVIETPSLLEIKPSYMKRYREKFIYDKDDETYANELKKSYNYIQNDAIYAVFDEMSEHIMKEKYILRDHLLDVVRNFERSQVGKKCLAENPYNNWSHFSDTAFNCRPYQMCAIS